MPFTINKSKSKKEALNSISAFIYSKTCLKRPLKIDKTKVLKQMVA